MPPPKVARPSAEAHCTWGDGPAVLISVAQENAAGFPLMLVDSGASFGVTVGEARTLARELLRAARLAELLARSLEGSRNACTGAEEKL